MTVTRKPTVFRLDAAESKLFTNVNGKLRPATVLVSEPDVFEALPVVISGEVFPPPKADRVSFWIKLFWSALTGLLSMAVGLWFWRLSEDLFRTNVVAGWIGIALISLVLLALFVLLIREVNGLMRLGAVTAIRTDSEAAFASDHGDQAKDVIRRLMQFQSTDPSSATQRAVMQGYMSEIIDGRGLLTLADRTLLQARDERAKAAIAAAAKRVSVVTAISPRAIVDILFVAAQSVMLTRRIAEIYGTRPGNLGFMRLARKILGHLAITGGVALTDSVLSQIVGHGMAARLSAKLGEGVLNGLLTARVGLACIEVCRPLPFLASDEPRLQDVAGEILSNPFGKKENE
jgi:putative membrane protein